MGKAELACWAIKVAKLHREGRERALNSSKRQRLKSEDADQKRDEDGPAQPWRGTTGL